MTAQPKNGSQPSGDTWKLTRDHLGSFDLQVENQWFCKLFFFLFFPFPTIEVCAITLFSTRASNQWGKLKIKEEFELTANFNRRFCIHKALCCSLWGNWLGTFLSITFKAVHFLPFFWDSDNKISSSISQIHLKVTVFILLEKIGDSPSDGFWQMTANASLNPVVCRRCRYMRTGGRASRTTSSQEARTAWWPLPMRMASGTTCPATTTCPTSARKAQVLWGRWTQCVDQKCEQTKHNLPFLPCLTHSGPVRLNQFKRRVSLYDMTAQLATC